MAAAYSFSISLRVSHPKMDLAILTTELRRKPSNSWRAGEPRRTPAGKPLDGVRRDNYWTARLVQKRYASSRRSSLEAALATVVGRMHAHRALFRRIQRSGGVTELFIGLFGEGGFNYGSDWSAELVSDMAKLGLSVSLDIYK